MNDKQKDDVGPETFFSDWMRTSMAYWESMAGMWSVFHASGEDTPNSKTEDKTSRFQKSWESTLKTWKAWSQVIAQPETLKTLSKDTGMIPEIFLRIAQTGLNGFFHFQRQWLDKAGKIQKSVQSYTFETPDQDVVKTWTKLFETEMKKVFNIPQLGLTRFYQEKMIRFVDKFTMFQSDLNEFLRLLSLPMENSFQDLQEQLAALADVGKVPEDSKVYYQMWIKVLEGHYMKMFQSSDYTKNLHKTLHAMSEFSEAKKELLEDILTHTFPVPTQKEMDELYKEIYLLKKRIKELEKRS